MRKESPAFQGGISTNEITEILVDLLNRIPANVDLSSVYIRLKWVHERINTEVKSFFEDGKCLPIIVDGKEDWCIHNFAKAETRGAIVESLLHRLELRSELAAKIQDTR